MSAAPVNLDQGPPLPQQLQPQPSVAQLAGQQGQAQQSGSASLQQQVIQKAMFVEQSLNDIATMMPSAAGMVGSWIDALRKGLGTLLAQGANAPAALGATGGSQLMNSAGGMGSAPSS